MIGGDGGQQITERVIAEVIDGADLRFMFVVERQVVRQGVTERKRTEVEPMACKHSRGWCQGPSEGVSSCGDRAMPMCERICNLSHRSKFAYHPVHNGGARCGPWERRAL